MRQIQETIRYVIQITYINKNIQIRQTGKMDWFDVKKKQKQKIEIRYTDYIERCDRQVTKIVRTVILDEQNR